MSSSNASQERFYERHAWKVLFALGIIMALSALFILFAGIDKAEFKDSTDMVWGDLTTSNPEVADYILRLLRLIGAGFLGFALFGAVVTWASYRKDERWAWYAMWAFPLVFGLASAIFFIYEAGALGLYYGGAAAISLLGLLLPIKKFFPS